MNNREVQLQGKHRINSLVFDLSIAEQADAGDLQDSLSTLLHGNVIKILAQMMDLYDRPGMLIQFDKMEVNLGHIRLDSLESDIEEKLPPCLDESLAEKLAAAAYVRNNSELFSKSVSTLAALKEYLLTGHFPEGTDENQFRNRDWFVFELMEQYPVQFRRLLNQVMLDESASERITSLMKNLSISELMSRNLDILVNPLDKTVVQQESQLKEATVVLPLNNILNDHLEYFLLTGFLPWNADLNQFRDIDRIVEDLIQGSPDRFRQLLHRVLSVKEARQRLVFNLKEETLSLLMLSCSEIQKQDYDHIQNFISWICDQLENAKVPIHKKLFRFESSLIQFFDSWGLESSSLVKSWLELAIQPSLFPSGRDWNNFKVQLKGAHVTGQHEPLEKMLTQHLDIIEQKIGQEQVEKVMPLSGLDSILDSDKNFWFIQNSGLILLWPYLKRFFENLKLVEGNRFVSNEHRMQAVHELEFLIHGAGEYREYHLVLNKMLCGVPLNEPVDPEFATQPVNRDESDNLLQHAIEKWEIIGKTSIDGFRNSFLTREGKLIEQENNWKLIIERKSYDVLLDQLPYPLSVVKLPWMDKAVFVEW